MSLKIPLIAVPEPSLLLEKLDSENEEKVEATFQALVRQKSLNKDSEKDMLTFEVRILNCVLALRMQIYRDFQIIGALGEILRPLDPLFLKQNRGLKI